MLNLQALRFGETQRFSIALSVSGGWGKPVPASPCAGLQFR